MANFDIATSTPVTSPTGTEQAYLLGKKRATLTDLKAFFNAGQVTTAQLATEQGRIAALETALPGKATPADITNAVSNRVTTSQLATEQARITSLEAGASTSSAAATALGGRVTSLEGRDLEVGNTIRTGTFNGVLGQIEPFSIAASNAVCVPPATGTLTDGVEFGVILHGTPGAFSCTVDFQSAGQILQGRSGANANVIITNEATPFTVRWSASHAQWFIIR